MLGNFHRLLALLDQQRPFLDLQRCAHSERKGNFHSIVCKMGHTVFRPGISFRTFRRAEALSVRGQAT